MLGQPVSMLIPRVVGFKLTGAIPGRGHGDRRCAHDHRDAARARGGRQVRGVLRRRRWRRSAREPRDDRQHVARVRLHGRDASPSTTSRIDYLRLTGRSPHQVALVEAYMQRAGPVARPLGRRATSSRRFSEYIELDLATVVPSIAGPKRPQDRVVAHRVEARLREGGLAGACRRCSRRDLHRRATAGSSAQGRRRRHRVDHLVHQHVQPVRHARGGAARAQRKRSWAHVQAVGEDLDGARIAGRHRLLREGGPVARPRGARLPPRRLRLHHVHRQLWAAAGAGVRRGQRPRPHRRLGAEREPQLRGPHQPRRQDELPRVAAARDRLRARWHHGPRLRDRVARQGLATASTSSSRTSGPTQTRSRASSAPRSRRRCSSPTTRPCSTATSAGADSTLRTARSSSGTRTRRTCASPRTSRA